MEILSKSTLNTIKSIDLLTKTNRENLLNAVIMYKKLKSREVHPSGRFDNAGRWYPDEYYCCCENIRRPSQNYPMSLNKHCRSIEHVAKSFNINEKMLRAAYNAFHKLNANFDYDYMVSLLEKILINLELNKMEFQPEEDILLSF